MVPKGPFSEPLRAYGKYGRQMANRGCCVYTITCSAMIAPRKWFSWFFNITAHAVAQCYQVFDVYTRGWSVYTCAGASADYLVVGQGRQGGTDASNQKG